MTIDDTTREKALKLLRRGVVTLSEAAALAKVSRQLVRYWCIQADIDPTKERARYLARLWK